MNRIVALLALAGVALAQQAGTSTPETPPQLTTYDCTGSSCSPVTRSITLDANWRWLHKLGSNDNCYKGNSWIGCSDPVGCATGCALDGADYPVTYGVSASGNALTIKFVTQHQYGTNVGGRLYLMETADKYKMFKLLNREFSFDVDVSKLECGLNGALYFVEMSENGDLGVGNNKAGARYGTGYCDAQCPHDIKFINGEANVLDWTPSKTNANTGTGRYGSCCSEMDIWEANRWATAYTPHTCTSTGIKRCESAKECGDNGSGDRYNGICDKDGCDWNAYRMGDQEAYGPSKLIDTSKPFTVVTQFITSDGTDSGDLIEIRRFYKQGDRVINNTHATIHDSLKPYNTVMDGSCNAMKSLFGDTNDFKAKGGLKAHGDPLKRGMVLVMSIWDDHDASMLWLDSRYPATSQAVGALRGPCATDSGVPKDVEAKYPNTQVIYSNIRYGTFGQTTPGVPAPEAPNTCSLSSPPTGASGVGTCSSVKAAGMCSATCNSGLTAVQGVCAATGGRWVIPPACKDASSVTCSLGSLPSGASGAGTCSSVQGGKTCDLVCQTGYTGTSGVCSAQGVWSTMPACSAVTPGATCSLGSLPSGASSAGTCGSVQGGKTCDLVCKSGYTGTTGVCSAQGSWSTAPVCTANAPATCSLGRLPTGATGAGTCSADQTSGTTCSLVCGSDYVASLGVCNSGSWTTLPTCAKSSGSPCDMPVSGLAGDGTCTADTVASGTTCAPVCAAGETPISGTCSDGKWLREPACKSADKGSATAAAAGLALLAIARLF